MTEIFIACINFVSLMGKANKAAADVSVFTTMTGVSVAASDFTAEFSVIEITVQYLKTETDISPCKKYGRCFSI